MPEPAQEKNKDKVKVGSARTAPVSAQWKIEILLDKP
jgi:hypothetical protein